MGQAFPPHRNALHGTVATPGQAPAPSQDAACVRVFPEQLAARHEVLVPGKVQVLTAPLHVDAQGAVPVQARWPVRGAPLTRLQVPASVVETLQNSHDPVQAVLQHTPSAQALLTHSRAAAQAWPLAFFAVQVPLTQNPLTQSVSATQAGDLQADIEAQMTPPGQAAAVGDPQVPLPLQVGAGFSWEPEHIGDPQLVVAGGKAQAPLPLQVPS